MARLVLSILVPVLWVAFLVLLGVVVYLACYNEIPGRERGAGAGAGVAATAAGLVLFLAVAATQDLLDNDWKYCSKRPNDTEDDEWKPSR